MLEDRRSEEEVKLCLAFVTNVVTKQSPAVRHRSGDMIVVNIDISPKPGAYLYHKLLDVDIFLPKYEK